MANYVAGVKMVSEECCACGMTFGMTEDFQNRALNDREIWFYCPRGHQQHYSGKTEAQKLKAELDRERQRREREEQRNQELEQQKHRVAAQNRRIRQRIKNGVCPCCNRTFSNLANHMATQHPDFGDERRLKTLRLAFGLTQADLEQETGVGTVYISRYENSKPVPEWAKDNIEWWLSQQSA